jgi:hypothetical protein
MLATEEQGEFHINTAEDLNGVGLLGQRYAPDGARANRFLRRYFSVIFMFYICVMWHAGSYPLGEDFTSRRRSVGHMHVMCMYAAYLLLK